MLRKIINTILLLSVSANLYALGLRTMVAVPISENDMVLRVMNDHVKETSLDNLRFSLAYGLPNDGALFIGAPYRLHPGGNNRLGNLSILYRHMLVRSDRADGTFRMGVLGGGLLPVRDNHKGGFQAGMVATYFKNKEQFDGNFVLAKGYGATPDTGMYNLSWQHRLAPDVFPEWGLPMSLQSVLEYNGRAMQNSHLIHQITAGLQVVMPQMIIEGGVYKNLNAPTNLGIVFGFRIRG